MKKAFDTFRLYGILLIVFLVFHRFIEDFVLETYLINILSYPISSTLNDLLFGGTCLLVIGIFIYKFIKSYKYSTETILTILLINLIYYVYRFPIIEGFIFNDTRNGADHLLSLNIWPAIKYLDLLIIYFVLVILESVIIFLVTKFKKGTTNEASQNYLETGYLFDEPLTDGKPDLLKRNDIAKQIALKISKTKSNNSSFAFGINGEWGSGKTSFIYLIEKHLPKYKRIIIKYNPWLSHDVQNIAISFFKTLSQELKPYHSGVSSNIIKYAKLLIEGSQSKYASIISTTLDYFVTETSLQKEFDKINDVFKKLDNQIIIIIDDVDRLDHQEINELLKLIRNSANFANTVFIVPYDRNYLIEALKSMNSYSPYNYLEKIFQLEIPLPKIENGKISNTIYDAIKPHLNEKDHDLIFNRSDKLVLFHGELPYFETHLFSLRDSNKFINLFLTYYSQIKNEINVVDLMNLSIFNLKYSGVYNILFKDFTYFLEQKESKNEDQYNIYLKNESTQDKIDNILVIKRYLLNHPENAGISKSQIDLIIKILLALFPEQDLTLPPSNMHEQGIASPLYFDRYIQLTLLKNNLSNSEFDFARKLSNNDFCDKINNWFDTVNKHELGEKLLNITFFENDADFQNIISGIFTYGRKSEVEPDLSQESLLTKLINKILEWKNTTNNTIGIKNFVKEEIFAGNIPYSFEIKFTNKLYENKQFNQVLSDEELLDIQIILFKTSLKKNKTLDDAIWQLYNSITGPKHLAKEIFEKTSVLFISHIEKHNLKRFLNQTIIEDQINKGTWGIYFQLINSVFFKKENFENFLKEQYKKKHLDFIQEYIDFYSELKEQSKNHISYPFSKLIPEK